jgi:hypothetical protein
MGMAALPTPEQAHAIVGLLPPPPPPPPPPPLLLLLLLLALLAASFCCWRRSVLGAASKPVDAEPRVVFDVRSYGASGDGQSDDTHAIQQALVAGAGRVVYFPAGTYRTTRMLTVQGPGTVVRGDSAALSCIKYGGSKGSPMAPVLYIPKEAAAATVHDLGIDQSADTGSYTEPVMFGHGVAKQSSPWWGCALIVSADDATIRSVSVRNSWDNGIAVGGYTTTCPSTPLIATPTRVSVLACRTQGCGCGVHPPSWGPGKKGGGVNIAGATRCVVADCISSGDSTGIIVDYGAGAECSISNCTVTGAVLDTLNPTNGSGLGYWLGSGGLTLSGCKALQCASQGFEFASPPASGNVSSTLQGCEARLCGLDGFYIKDSHVSLVGCRAVDCSQRSAGQHSGALICASPVVLSACVLDSASHKASIEENPSGVKGGQVFCNLYTGCMVRGEVLMLASSKSVSRDNIDVNV